MNLESIDIEQQKLICYEKILNDSIKLNLHHNIDLETL